jgi:radical SAM protein with 4Fe4S-binding SPASM domain
MSNIISAKVFERKRYEKIFDKNVDPCSECVDKPYCSDTCHHARMWWATAAKKLREGTL